MKKTVNFILMATVLLSAVFYASCSSDDGEPPVVKTELTASIVAANLLISTTSEGVGTGNYLKGSQADLISAIALAQQVLDNASAPQATVTNATVALAAAVAEYKSNIVIPIDPSNLIAQWTFDELTTAAIGTAVKDYSGNNRNGTLKTGHATFGTGVPALGADRYGVAGKALLLDKGANVEIPYNTALNPTNSLSISVWVKLDEKRNNRFIGLQSWLGYKFEVQDANVPFGTVQHSGGAYDRGGVLTLELNKWYHLVMTFTPGTMVFYVNGVMTKTNSDTPNAPVSISGKPYNLVLGCDFPTDKYSSGDGANFDVVGNADYHVIPAAWGGYLHGSLDEVRLYKSALTAAQVTSIYDVEKP